MRDHSKELMEFIKEKGAELLLNLEDKLIFYRHLGMIYRFSFDKEADVYRNCMTESIEGTVHMLHLGEDFIRKTVMKEIRMDSKGATIIERKSEDN